MRPGEQSWRDNPSTLLAVTRTCLLFVIQLPFPNRKTVDTQRKTDSNWKMWRWTIDKGLKSSRLSHETTPTAANRIRLRWRSFAVTSCARQHREDWLIEWISIPRQKEIKSKAPKLKPILNIISSITSVEFSPLNMRNTFAMSFFCIPSHISGIHHFWWNFCICDRF